MISFLWKKSKIVDKLAYSLADELYSQVPPEVALKYFREKSLRSSKKVSKKGKSSAPQHKRFDDTVVMIIGRIQEFRQAHKLGVYSKARLHLKFTQRLSDLGYSEETAKQINQFIMVRSP